MLNLFRAVEQLRQRLRAVLLPRLVALNMNEALPRDTSVSDDFLFP